MDKAKIERINELGRLSKERELTEAILKMLGSEFLPW